VSVCFYYVQIKFQEFHAQLHITSGAFNKWVHYSVRYLILVPRVVLFL
jgi:hypothetical protein